MTARHPYVDSDDKNQTLPFLPFGKSSNRISLIVSRLLHQLILKRSLRTWLY